MSYNWQHAVYNLFQTSLFYLITLIQVSSISFCDLIAHFILFLNNILLCWWTIVCLSILLKDPLIASNLCACVCEREREYELSCYKIHVHVFVWAVAIKSFAELSRSIIIKSCGMTTFSAVRYCFQIAFPLTTNESSCCPSSLLVNGFSDFAFDHSNKSVVVSHCSNFTSLLWKVILFLYFHCVLFPP